MGFQSCVWSGPTFTNFSWAPQIQPTFLSFFLTVLEWGVLWSNMVYMGGYVLSMFVHIIRILRKTTVTGPKCCDRPEGHSSTCGFHVISVVFTSYACMHAWYPFKPSLQKDSVVCIALHFVSMGAHLVYIGHPCRSNGRPWAQNVGPLLFVCWFCTYWKFNCKQNPKYNQPRRTNATRVEINKVCAYVAYPSTWTTIYHGSR